MIRDIITTLYPKAKNTLYPYRTISILGNRFDSILKDEVSEN